MRIAAKVVLWTLAAGAMAAGLITAIGYSLPQAHVATRSTVLAGPPADVFRKITDVRAFPSWRSDVRNVEVLAEWPRLRWTEEGPDGAITFEADESVAPTRFVSRIADPDLPFGGSWTFELRRAGDATALAITERGEVYNPIFRFVSRFALGHTATLDRYLSDLERQIGRAR